ncbi:hypothetical protein R3X28_05110 [Maribacter sp. TH_r10]|uniref:hypothetical protein n=1 Tax=Maribacter sp. TH_r10 TaxID=3082086 RepID=UPI0029550C2C|nr:hypothetical protein [Maribacter sp. TH_r10]MDV7138242.1 hypothetical protein [Maribacter sp. TH_r10]
MNRYIKAMEIGLANEKDGISYFDLVEELEEALGYSMEAATEATFYFWFVDNYSTQNYEIKLSIEWKSDFQTYLDLKHMVVPMNMSKREKAQSISKRIKNVKWFLNGNAAKQYLDYQELQESRIAAKQASKQSNYSIGIAIGAIIMSTFLGAISIFSSPKPPFDVNILEDRNKLKQLERELQQLKIDIKKENNELKERLYEAEMLIAVYESDSL